MEYRAAFREHYCNPENLKVQKVSTPALKPHQILVKVYCTTVNRSDCAVLSGYPFVLRFFTGLRKPKLKTTGTDFAGVVEQIGSSVSNFKIGDRIFGFNDEGLGSHGEYCVVSKEEPLHKIPANISFEQAAASLEAAHYAFNFLSKIELHKGDAVLVNGGTGAIGSAAIQMLKTKGVKITAVCGSKHMETVRSLGADTVLSFETEDFTQTQKTYNFILDAVGKSSFKKCKPLLKRKGVYISSELGDKIENPFLALTTPFFGGKKVIFPLPVDIKRSLRAISQLLEADEFSPLIDREYPLSEVSKAFTYVASGQKIGNVILRMEN